MTSQIWKTGTVTVTNGSVTVTGTGTGWLTAGVAGGDFKRGGLSELIESVETETSLTLAQPWSGATGTGVYSVNRFASEASDIVAVYDKFSQSIIRHALTSIAPQNSGSIAKRDALTLTLDDEGYVFLHAEDANASSWDLYLWDGTDWVGPQPV